jgi:carbon-monoxide dehydrogenase medium subunit
MKLPRFDYARPKTLREAIGLLGATDGAKLLAGGQSLIPVMAYRLAAPPLLVDICDLE